MKEISVKALRQLMLEEELNLIDVRETDEYETFHIPGAVSIPLDKLSVQKIKLKKDETYYIVCKGGTRSKKAVAYLNSQGFNAINICGGTLAWRDLFSTDIE